METLTIFTPTYNRAKFLPRAFEALKRQTLKDFLWMIIDDGRGLGVIHPKNEPFYVTKFRAEEMERLRQTEQQEDLYTKMWKEFFYTIAVEKRENPGCQRNMFPLRYRKHVTEFL